MLPPEAITGRQIAAARALTSTSQADLAEASGIPLKRLRRMEANSVTVPASSVPADVAAVRRALEQRGAVFVPEDDVGGVGVRLKFNRIETRQIGGWEGEGGLVGDDDVQ
jgi:hypothetical protein